MYSERLWNLSTPTPAPSSNVQFKHKMSADSSHSEETVALGSEFCSGYIDTMGKWTNGFYCPGELAEEQFCCGTANFKYCCAQREQVLTQDTSRLPLLLGVMFGAVTAILIVTVMMCWFCACCFFYKKRQPRVSGGPLYRMHCSSTASGVANMYSFSNPNSLATTPLDSAVASSRLLVDLEPVVAHSIVPNETRSMMARGNTFSREACSTGMDLHVSELGEMNDRVPGTGTSVKSPGPPLSFSSSKDEQHQDTTVKGLSHGTTFRQQIFNPARPLHTSTSLELQSSPCVISETPICGTTKLEPQLPSSTFTFTSTGVTTATCTTFNPSSTAKPAGSISLAAQAAVSGAGPVLLAASSTPLVTTTDSREHDALYHSTKF
ncbi:uncharacterized protein LOC110834590 isoform X2 [Zootermopsis nevadensis]|nr:uncharacterized protein LOC110834590 isoform X2 [Zootermopsis nevadensis]